MGVSTSPEQLSAKFRASAAAIQRQQRETLDTAADIVRTRVLSQAAGEIGGDLTFGGKKRVGVTTKVGASQAEVRATGVMHWLERGVQPHAIAPKGAGGSRAARSAFISQAFGSGRSQLSFGRGRKAGALRFASGEIRPYARAAGRFRARRSWSKGVEKSAVPVRQAFQRGTTRAAFAPFR